MGGPEVPLRYSWCGRRFRERLTLAQYGKCRICGKDAEVLDHDHKSGAPRGMVCRSCNSMLGKIETSGQNVLLTID
ncbi:MAG: hypothetical protein KGI38_12070 [Thaumarchaeota archaeon]|nr:hypothetical protein [Nitrososphaerota archaeon]